MKILLYGHKIGIMRKDYYIYTFLKTEKDDGIEIL